MRRLIYPMARLLLSVLVAGAIPAGLIAQDDEEDKLPEPLDVEFTTKDGLNMSATFYASKEGKKAVPVMILHEWKSDRSKYRDLALVLQEKGHAVLVPDLRGHGGSTRFDESLKRRPLVASRLRTDDFGNMVQFDIERCKSFLLQLNNKGELNIEKLCLVGVELGAVLALQYAHSDWAWPQLPNLKQGQDVNGLVLISPPLNFRGMSVSDVLNENRRASRLQNYASNQIRRELSTMIVCGEADSDSMRDSEKIFGIMANSRPKVDKKDRAEKETLFFFPQDTTLQGDKLINQKQFRVPLFINGFINARLVKKSFPWTDRTSP